ncbi:trypsin-like peptidase domain-containing protein [Thermodesulfobacteriota bacterium]
MDNSEVTIQIKEIKARQERLIESIDKSKVKDGWDKFSIITSFISGVLLVVVGGAFTYLFQAQQTERQLTQQAEQKKLEEHRNRLLELDAVSNLLPFLTDPDENKQKAGYLALNTLASTKIVATLAKLRPSAGAAAALSTIAASPLSSDQDRQLAESALKDLFLKNRAAVVKIRSVANGVPRESSGFFISSDGYLITADFSVNTQSDEVSIITVDGQQHRASVIAISEEHGVTVLKVDSGKKEFLPLSDSPPQLGDPLLIIGSTGTEHLIPALGKVQQIGDQSLQYLRERESMQGFAGGPVINENGIVVGVHRAGWKNKQGIGGIGECRRTDKIKAFLLSLSISIS